MMLFCEPWFASLGFFYLFFAICHWLPNGKSAGQHYDDQEPHKLCRTWLAVEARRNLGSAARRAQRCKKQRRLAVRHVRYQAAPRPVALRPVQRSATPHPVARRILGLDTRM